MAVVGRGGVKVRFELGQIIMPVCLLSNGRQFYGDRRAVLIVQKLMLRIDSSTKACSVPCYGLCIKRNAPIFLAFVMHTVLAIMTLRH